ncbi:DUF2339 domain-containing protein [Bacillus spongiae]|uniref:DUF2339 domain-containing protein n=1 Tax=Bacillus spongiae TaxID=2683610 RepID=A0ABU8HBE9_9BACI
MNDKIQELQNRVEQLEKQVNDLEQKMNTSVNPSHPKAVSLIDSSPSNQNEENVKTWGENIGQKWLPRIFIFVLLLGIVWGFAAAVEGNYITEQVRIAIGFGTAVLFYFVGTSQFKKHRLNLAYSLLGGTIVILFLTTFSAHMLYEFIPFWPAFILNLSWLLFGLYTAYKFHSEVIAVIVSVGGFLVPFLLNGQEGGEWLFYTYETLLYIVFLLYSFRYHYQWLHYVSFFFLPLTIITYLLLSGTGGEAPAYMMIIQHVCIGFILFYKLPLHYRHHIATLIPSTILTSLFVLGTFKDWKLDAILLIAIIAYTTLSLSLFYMKSASERIALAAFPALYLIAVYTNHLFDNELLTILIMFQAGLGIYYSTILKSRLILFTSGVTFLIGAIRVYDMRLWTLWSFELLAWLAFFVLCFALIVLTHKLKELSFQIIYKCGVVLFSFMLLVFLWLLGPLLTVDYSSMVQQMVISLLWLCYAVGYILFGKWKNIHQLESFGLIMIFVVLLKGIFIDLPISSLAIRAILFIVLGTIGLIVSRFSYGKNH